MMSAAIEVLNKLHAEGKLSYRDYSELFDAIIDDLKKANANLHI